jgi:hypothetical protein
MKDGSEDLARQAAGPASAPSLPAVVDRATFQAELDKLRVREKAHTREGDAIAAARRRLPMVEVDPNLTLIGPQGPLTLLEAFEGRQQLIAYYFMWRPGRPAAEQCEGCTWVTTQVAELSYLHSRDITYAVFCQGPYDESIRYREFMDWHMPWYSALPSLDTLLVGRHTGTMHLVCYLRDGEGVMAWLAAHPRVQFHCTPVGSSWINQIETWFGIITRQVIRRGTFPSVRVLIGQIRDYITDWNTDAKPFVWTATADEILAKVQLVQTNIKQLVANNAK